MKISLIIPAYNEEAYIGACLDAAQKAAGSQFFEIIVIDNASTDRTSEVASTRPGIRVVQEDKKGLTQARQRGYVEAKGDILAYIDADTRMPQGWYETLVKEFTQQPQLACLSGPYIYYDAPRWQQLLVKYGWWYLLAYPTSLVIGYMAIGGNFAIRREVLDKMSGFDTTIAFYGEDTNIARRAHEHGRVQFSPTFVMYTSNRRLQGQGFWTTGWLYLKNFLSEVVLHRPSTQAYQDIR